MFGAIYVLFAVVGFSLVNGLATRRATGSQTESVQQNKKNIDHSKEFSTDAAYRLDPDADALEQISKKMTEEKHKPYSVSLTYKMADNKVLATTTKVHYKEYRKKPVYERVVYANEVKPDATITFMYKPKAKSFVKICTDKKSHERSIEHLELPSLNNSSFDNHLI